MWSNIKHYPLSFLTREDPDLRVALLLLNALTSVISPVILHLRGGYPGNFHSVKCADVFCCHSEKVIVI